MPVKFEARSQKMLFRDGEDQDAPDTDVEDYELDQALCKNCNRLIRKLSPYLGEDNPGGLNTPSTYAEVSIFKRDQKIDIENCRLCRVIQRCSPRRFAAFDRYPRVALVNRRKEWGRKLFKLEFAEASGYPSLIGALYLLERSDLPSIVPDIASWVTYGSTLQCAKVWLDSCKQHHSCRDESQNYFHPTRLLYIGNPGCPVRLASGNFLPPYTKYATLSHCWGSYKPNQLLESNLEEFQTSIEFDTLSKTFQDAINTARSLGLEYIWIDSLCIIQDSKSDWSKESVRMNGVYASSYLNIAAAAAVDGREGLFFPQTANHEADMEANFKMGPKNYRVLDSRHWSNAVECLPLYSRAWVYQERLLAPRNLYFAKDSIAWECDHCRLSETFPLVMPVEDEDDEEDIDRLNPWISKIVESSKTLKTSTTKNKAITKDSAISSESVYLTETYKQWKRTVTSYSRGSLTFAADKLTALSGIASRFDSYLSHSSLQKAGQDQYLAGLWHNDLIHQLLWYVAPGAGRPTSPTSEEKHEKSYIAPSWSWASLELTKTPILFHGPPNQDKDDTHDSRDVANLVKVDVALASPSPFGPLSGGELALLARIFKANLLFRPSKPHCDCCDEKDFFEFDVYVEGGTWDADGSSVLPEPFSDSDSEDGDNDQGGDNDESDANEKIDTTGGNAPPQSDAPAVEGVVTPTEVDNKVIPSKNKMKEIVRRGSPVRIYPDTTWQGLPDCSTESDLYFIPLVEDIFGFQSGGWGNEPGERKWCTWHTGLVLKKDEQSEGSDEPLFRRWGTWKVSTMDAQGGCEWLDDAYLEFNGKADELGLKPVVRENGEKVYQVRIV